METNKRNRDSASFCVQQGLGNIFVKNYVVSCQCIELNRHNLSGLMYSFV